MVRLIWCVCVLLLAVASQYAAEESSREDETPRKVDPNLPHFLYMKRLRTRSKLSKSPTKDQGGTLIATSILSLNDSGTLRMHEAASCRMVNSIWPGIIQFIAHFIACAIDLESADKPLGIG